MTYYVNDPLTGGSCNPDVQELRILTRKRSPDVDSDDVLVRRGVPSGGGDIFANEKLCGVLFASCRECVIKKVSSSLASNFKEVLSASYFPVKHWPVQCFLSSSSV